MKLRIVIGLLAAATLSGCETFGYYAQAVEGHLELMADARPVASWLADPATPPALRARLEEAQRIRAFASAKLGLPDNGSFTRYADLRRPYAVWNVFATKEFSADPVPQCFVVAGCVSYRGFYAEADARAYALELRARGDDVFVGGVPAYSTLGWFNDPLLSTFIGYPEAELARIVFHELAHQVLYVPGDTTFNESFAVTVEREGVRRWLKARGRERELAAFVRGQARSRDIAALIEDARARLRSLYALPLEPRAMREGKRRVFAQMHERYEALKARWGGYTGYDRVFEGRPNNATLVAFAAYSQDVPAFERLLAQVGGDLPRFYARVKGLAGLPPAQRKVRLAALAG